MATRFFRAAGLGGCLSVALLCGVAAPASAGPATGAPLDLNGLITAPAAEPAVTPTADFAPPAVEPPVAQSWAWSLTPRAWFLWENDFYFQPENRRFQQSNEATFIPFAGGSVSVTPGDGAQTYSLTVLYGEGTGDFHGVQGISPGGINPNVIDNNVWEGEVETTRLDIEAIAQIPAAAGANWILGARYINFRREETADIFFERSDLDRNVLVRQFLLTNEEELEQNFYLGEAGFGVNQAVNSAGTLVAFGNLIGMLGFADVVDRSPNQFGVFNLQKDDLQGGVFGVDTNAGLGYRISPSLFASARYRLFYLTAPNFKFKDGGTFMHGPEVNLTFTFGG